MVAPRILVVSGSAGHGHVMAAEAVTAALRAHQPEAEVLHLDALTRMARWYARTYRWGYVRMVDRHPHVWRRLYEDTDRRTSTAGHFLTLRAGKGLVEACEKFQPQTIVCTHFLAPEVLSHAIAKGRLHCDVQAVVTDHDIHRVWVWPAIRRYYVASEQVKARLALRYGVPTEQISVTGIPVRPQFQRRIDTPSVRAQYGLDARRPTVLFLSGGFATGQMRESILGLWHERPDVQILAVCGRNERLRRRVASVPRPAGASLNALGFVEDVAGLIEVADLVVGKSGGITTSECMAMGTPLIVSNAIAGQEERNALALVEAGAGAWAPTPEEVRWRVGRLLGDSAALSDMTAKARAFGRPGAAGDIAKAVLGDQVRSATRRLPHFHGA